MKKMILMIAVFTMLLTSCSKHIHRVGNGASGKGEVEKRQWYILYGLVPLNSVDTNQMAGDALDYQVETEQTGLDIVINMFTMYVTVGSRTVTVKK